MRRRMMGLGEDSQIEGIFSENITGLDAGATGGGDYFGQTVAMDDKFALIQSAKANSSKGLVALYSISGTEFTYVQNLIASDGASDDNFGGALGIDGDYAIVGAPGHEGGGYTNSGAAYIFKRTAGVWAQQQILLASDITSHHQFGIAVAISGDYAFVTCLQKKLYIFERSGTTWTEIQKITRSSNTFFGACISVSGTKVVVGAPNDTTVHGANAGSVFIFEESGGVWSLSQTISDGAANAKFGFAVSMDEDFLLVGSQAANSGQGSAVFYELDGGSWTFLSAKVSPTPENYSYFSSYCAMSNGVAVMTQYNATLDARVHLYRYDGSDFEWFASPISGTVKSDYLGQSVAINKKAVVVGAKGDDTHASNSGMFQVYI